MILSLRPRRSIMGGLCAVALLCFAPAGVSAAQRPPAFPELVENYYEELLALFPVDAAGSGDSDHRYEHVWQNDISAGHRAQEAAFCARYLHALTQVDRTQLPASEQLSYDILKWSLEIRREGLGLPNHLLPVNQFWGPPLTFAQMGSGASLHPFHSLQDYRNFISRADGFSDWVDTAISNMREGVKSGVVQPKILMERCLAQYVPLLADDPESNVFFAPLKSLPADATPGQREELKTAYEKTIRQTIIPAYARLHDFVKTEYLPHCRDTSSISALPGGKEMYAFWVRYWTTTNRSPEEIHSLGLSEVARVKSELEKIKVQVGFTGSLPTFLDYVAKDPKFAPFTADDQVLAAYRGIEARLQRALPKFFGTMPRSKFEIRPTEKFRAASASAEYQPGSSDGLRPGVFYVPIVNPRDIRTPQMEDLFLHEAIPGHHFQISIAMEKADLPRFRRYGWNSAYGEGWALYAESLGQELGLYTDPFQYVGMLLGDMHRAVRLVVDTGLHAKGWTREQALQYSVDQEGGAPEHYVAEVERYIAAPAQALSYKIGQLKIIELRRHAEKELGAKFDIRAYHDLILNEGTVPLAVLEKRVQAWIAQRPEGHP